MWTPEEEREIVAGFVAAVKIIDHLVGGDAGLARLPAETQTAVGALRQAAQALSAHQAGARVPDAVNRVG